MKEKPYNRLTVYETQSRFYLVGRDAARSSFAVLKIDRTESNSLTLCDGGNKYNRSEINELLSMINDGNQNPVPSSSSNSFLFSSDRRAAKSGNVPNGLTERVANCYGLLGFVRFLRGYYMILVTKASHAAQLGYHSIYKIEDVAMISIPSDSSSNNSDEQRYLRLFQSVDLTTNFYFSYTYDLSRTLQENVLKPFDSLDRQFVWNKYLMEPILNQNISLKWTISIVHGYIGQAKLALPASKIGLLLMGRRSCRYAGTRFLKRGANLAGHVGNDVETEQIVWDCSGPPGFELGKFTSFVQRRGSVPLIWSQDPTNRPPVVMGKPPPIQLDLADPLAQVPALHFRDLRMKYSDPIIVINLIKRRERRTHESILHDHFVQAVNYLNQFVSPSQAILYLSFDIARCNKVGNVLPKLQEIGYNVVSRQGWFQSFLPLYCHHVRPSPLLKGYHPIIDEQKRLVLQLGVSRTNCVDCLDRTNVAQFVIGKVALAHQLYALGFLSQPVLSLCTETCQLLEILYEDHGDTLALQYAGSQLVHSIKTYKKVAVFQERSRDVIQTLSRYYSNTFGDYDKQNAINVFLGVYRPAKTQPALWDLSTDVYLHNVGGRPKADYCAWFEPYNDESSDEEVNLDETLRPESEMDMDLSKKNEEETFQEDQFDLHYRTFKMTSFDSLLPRLNNLQKTITVEAIDEETNSGGQPLVKLPKRPPDSGQTKTKKKGFWETGDSDKKDPSAEDSSSEDEENQIDSEIVYESAWRTGDQSDACLSYDELQEEPLERKVSLTTGLKTMRQAYGYGLKKPSAQDMAKYQAYSKLGGLRLTDDDLEWMRTKRLSELDTSDIDYLKMKPVSVFTTDSVFGVEVPVVGESALRKYKEAVACAIRGPKAIGDKDMRIYKKYAIVK